MDLVEGGRKVSEVASEFGESEQTIYVMRRQARIDAGLEAGVTSFEHAELVAAKKRIRELETEAAIHLRSTEGEDRTSLPFAMHRLELGWEDVRDRPERPSSG